MSILQDTILLVEIVGTLVICVYCAAGLFALLTKRDRLEAQLLVANGAMLGMSVKVIGALLKTIQLQTWNQLGQFAAIFMLKILIKKAFLRDSKTLRRLNSSKPHTQQTR